MNAAPYTLSIGAGPIELFLLVATRLLAALSTSPVISTRTIPLQARIGLGLFAALVLTPVVSAAIPADQQPVLSWTTLAGEVVTGTLAGLAASMVYAAVEFGAGLLDVQAGFGLGATYDPTFDASGSVLNRFYSALAALVFFETNGHHLLLQALVELFHLVPLGQFSLDQLQPDRMAQLAAGMFVVALQLVLPVLGALLLVDVALALLNRAAPQFNPFALGASAKTGLAALAALATLPYIMSRLPQVMSMAAGFSTQVLK